MHVHTCSSRLRLSSCRALRLGGPLSSAVTASGSAPIVEGSPVMSDRYWSMSSMSLPHVSVTVVLQERCSRVYPISGGARAGMCGEL